MYMSTECHWLSLYRKSPLQYHMLTNPAKKRKDKKSTLIYMCVFCWRSIKYQAIWINKEQNPHTHGKSEDRCGHKKENTVDLGDVKLMLMGGWTQMTTWMLLSSFLIKLPTDQTGRLWMDRNGDWLHQYHYSNRMIQWVQQTGSQSSIQIKAV